MGRVFVDVGMSLDGFIAGPNGGPSNPLGDGGMRIHAWVYPLAAFRNRLGMEGGERGRDNDLIEEVFSRTGAYVMGRRMFDEGEVGWPEDPPFRAPVTVLTHRLREPWVRKGGTTFTFANDNIRSVVAQARAAAGDRDVRFSGGADVIQQALEAGLVDELTIHLAPVVLGKGVPLFGRVALDRPALELREVTVSPTTTHLSYGVSYPGDSDWCHMDSERVLVFFYGLFMDRKVLEERGIYPPEPQRACAEGYALHIGKRATLVPTEGAQAYGMLYSLTRAELDGLYAQPGLEAYQPVPIGVRQIDGTRRQALCYVLARAPDPGEANTAYASQLREVLRRLEFPEDYVRTVG